MVMTIYGSLGSGNCLKVKYIADATGQAYDWKQIDIGAGETRTAEFRAINPAGQVPAVMLADGRPLAQSNAILRHLARGTRFMPEDDYLAAKVDEWFNWEQYSHEPYVSGVRSHVVYRGGTVETRDPSVVKRAEAALDYLERALETAPFLVGDSISVADIALLAYTRLSPQGGIDLGRWPAVSRWIGDCERELGLSALESATAHQGDL